MTTKGYWACPDHGSHSSWYPKTCGIAVETVCEACVEVNPTPVYAFGRYVHKGNCRGTIKVTKVCGKSFQHYGT